MTTLNAVSTELMSAANGLQASEMAPTARELSSCTTARANFATVMAKWTKITTIDLPALNLKRKAAGQPAVVVR